MATIIGRESELMQLKRFYHSKKAELLAIYGRRRIGKTFLIQSKFAKEDCVFFHNTGLKNGSLRAQIENFTRVMGKTFYEGAELRLKNTWLDVFDQLTVTINKIDKKKKVVLFFDELPWMATTRSQLIQALDHYWNRYWSTDPRIKFIVCGSSASWILDKIVNNTGGLYNRLTYQIELKPFSLNESQAFLASNGIKLTHDQVLQLYMVMGGVPLYLDQIRKGLSAAQNIDEICFTKQGMLFNEYHKLFASLFKRHEIMEELVGIIAKYQYGILQTDLMRLSSKSVGGRLTKRLKELENAGFIESFISYQHKERGIYYRIIDEYTLFYLKWIQSVIHSVKRHDKEKGYWLSKQKSPAWENWAGYSFENICYKHMSEIRKALKIDPEAEVGSWRYVPRAGTQKTGAQINLLFDRNDDVITICEIKYTSRPYVINKQQAQILLNKVNVFKEQIHSHKQIFIVLISAHGLKQTMYSEELITGLITLMDLF